MKKINQVAFISKILVKQKQKKKKVPPHTYTQAYTHRDTRTHIIHLSRHRDTSYISIEVDINTHINKIYGHIYTDWDYVPVYVLPLAHASLMQHQSVSALARTNTNLKLTHTNTRINKLSPSLSFVSLSL